MANTSSKLHIPPTNYLLAAQEEPYKKSLTLNVQYLSFLERKKVRRMDH